MKINHLLLKNKGSKKQRYWKVQTNGKTIKVAYGKKLDKLTSKEISFESEQKANREAAKRHNKKLEDGYAYFKDAEMAAIGEALLLTVVPDKSTAHFFDISSDNKTLAVGTIKKGAYGAALYLVDIATNAWTILHEEEPQHPRSQTFIHSVHFNKDDTKVYYTLNEQTKVIDLSTKQVETLANFFRPFKGEEFNPFCMQPTMDKAKERYLYFDHPKAMKVRDAEGNILFHQPNVGTDTIEGRYAAISPSGKYIALYRASRHVIYGHTDAVHDKTKEVQIWDIDKQTLLHTMPVEVEKGLHSIGFAPDEEHLVTTWRYVQGPVLYHWKTGKEVYKALHYRRTDRLDVCFNHIFSPDGQLFIVGGFGVQVLNTTTKEAAFQLSEQSSQRAYGLRFSKDGKYLVVGGDRGYLLVYKMT